jgi:transposase
MANAHSVDLCRRVVRAVEAGASCRQAAARFEVGVSSAIRRVAQLRETGDIAPKPRGGSRRASRIDPHGSLIMEWIAAEPDLTLPEIAAKLDDAVGLFLLPYSPDFNPIEMAFSKIKASLKKGRRSYGSWPLGRHSRHHQRRNPTGRTKLLHRMRL